MRKKKKGMWSFYSDIVNSFKCIYLFQFNSSVEIRALFQLGFLLNHKLDIDSQEQTLSSSVDQGALYQESSLHCRDEL
jgi:hypothetical protein